MGKADKTEKTNKKQRHFWKDFKAELKKVIWPTRSQVVNNTIVVLVIVLIVTAIVFLLDLAFEALNTYGIDNLKTLVQESGQTNTVNEEEQNTEENNSEGENSTDSEDTNTQGDTAEEGEADNTQESNEVTDTANVENISE